MSLLKSMQQRPLVLLPLLLFFVFALPRVPCKADGFGLEARCIGAPNEESGSVFSITSVVTVPTLASFAYFVALPITSSPPSQCTVSVDAPCNAGYSLSIAIIGNNTGILQRHDEPVVCGQVQYGASFVLANRYILSNR